MVPDSLLPKTYDLLLQLSEDQRLTVFGLIGGSALALHYGHRISEDLDFAFPGRQLDRQAIQQIVQSLRDSGRSIVYNNPISAIHDAINDGLDLDDYHQDYLIDGVKLTFFVYGENQAESDLLRNSIVATTAQYGHVRIVDPPTLFATKCLALCSRIASRDLFDLWWLTHHTDDFSVLDVFETVQSFRSYLQYEHIRYRLLDWPIPDTDPGFAHLLNMPITVADVRHDFTVAVQQIEVDMAATLSRDFSQ